MRGAGLRKVFARSDCSMRLTDCGSVSSSRARSATDRPSVCRACLISMGGICFLLVGRASGVRHIEHECTLHRLIGVTAENANIRVFMDRETVIACVSEGGVNLAEDMMDERANWK